MKIDGEDHDYPETGARRRGVEEEETSKLQNAKMLGENGSVGTLVNEACDCFLVVT